MFFQALGPLVFFKTILMRLLLFYNIISRRIINNTPEHAGHTSSFIFSYKTLDCSVPYHEEQYTTHENAQDTLQNFVFLNYSCKTDYSITLTSRRTSHNKREHANHTSFFSNFHILQTFSSPPLSPAFYPHKSTLRHTAPRKQASPSTHGRWY